MNTERCNREAIIKLALHVSRYGISIEHNPSHATSIHAATAEGMGAHFVLCSIPGCGSTMAVLGRVSTRLLCLYCARPWSQPLGITCERVVSVALTLPT